MNEDQDITYKAYPISKIFDHIYGKDWSKNEEAAFTCLDGYKPSTPTEHFRKFEAFLAFERIGNADFSIKKKNANNKKINVGPLYLIWDNLKQKDGTTLDGSFWAYQLIEVDLTTFAEYFPRLAPPKKSSEKVKSGFLAFRKNCIECHSLNGDGGHIGPELNYPVSVTEYYKRELLQKWIDNPASIRFNTKMPPLSKDIKNRVETIHDILAYLESMQTQKTKPKDLP